VATGLSKTKVVCPTAPTRPVRLNMGMAMPAWFDLPPMGPEMLTSIDWEGVRSSTRQVTPPRYPARSYPALSGSL
jgi:hypothetical protein